MPCRIDPRTEAAHLRMFKPDALQHVRTHRQEMVAAGLTLLRAFIAAGRARATKDRLGSYETFDDLIRQCVIWLGSEGVHRSPTWPFPSPPTEAGNVATHPL